MEERNGAQCPFSSLTKELARFVATHANAQVMGAHLIVFEWDSLMGSDPVRMSMKIFGGDEGRPLFLVDFLDARPLCEGASERFLDLEAVEMSVLHMFKPKRSVALYLHIDDCAQTAIVRITDAVPSRARASMPRQLLAATGG